jgi:hypothetical protein
MAAGRFTCDVIALVPASLQNGSVVIKHLQGASDEITS